VAQAQEETDRDHHTCTEDTRFCAESLITLRQQNKVGLGGMVGMVCWNGLNYAIYQKQPNLEEIVADVKSCIKGFQYVEKEHIRREVGEEEQEAIALLKEKDCYFLKADKENSVVGLDTSD
jgi:hypothetical protein